MSKKDSVGMFKNGWNCPFEEIGCKFRHDKIMNGNGEDERGSYWWNCGMFSTIFKKWKVRKRRKQNVLIKQIKKKLKRWLLILSMMKRELMTAVIVESGSWSKTASCSTCVITTGQPFSTSLIPSKLFHLRCPYECNWGDTLKNKNDP